MVYFLFFLGWGGGVWERRECHAWTTPGSIHGHKRSGRKKIKIKKIECSAASADDKKPVAQVNEIRLEGDGRVAE